MKALLAAAGVVCLLVSLPSPGFGQPPPPAVKTTTRDIPFISYDGHAMVGRLTLPDTSGPRPILALVQTAEAQTMDGELQNAAGVRVRVYSQYREQRRSASASSAMKDAASPRTPAAAR